MLIGVGVDGDQGFISLVQDCPVFIGDAETNDPVLGRGTIEQHYPCAGSGIFTLIHDLLQNSSSGGSADLCILPVETGYMKGLRSDVQLGMNILQLFEGGNGIPVEVLKPAFVTLRFFYIL